MRRSSGAVTIGIAVLLAITSLTGVQAAPPPRAPVYTSPDAIPGQWIVALDDATAPKDRRALMGLVRGQRGKVIREYQEAFNGFAATMSDRTLEQLRRIPAVDFIEANARISLPSPTSQVSQTGANWGLDRIDQRDLPLDGSYTYSYDGAGVTAYILDSGVRADHVEFGGRVTGGWDFIDNDPVAEDCLGHGTPVAGIVGSTTYGVAKAVDLVPVRMGDCSGNATWAGILAGIDWITADHQTGEPAVANASLGGDSRVVERGLEKSVADGITWVVSAGNVDTDACNYSIGAHVGRAIVVGASDASDTRSTWSYTQASNWGPCVDLFAPGTAVTSTTLTTATSTGLFGGTSAAAPYVAGVAALYLSKYPHATPTRVKGALLNNATVGKITDPKGSPNRLLYSGFLNTP